MKNPRAAQRTKATQGETASDSHVCPWWVGYLLLFPLRRLVEDPGKILGPHVRTGMTVLEPGCAMGFFSLPLARMVGPQGRVICVDVEPRMIARLRRRAHRAGLADRIDASICARDDLGIDRRRGEVDLVVAIHVVHEVLDQKMLLTQLFDALRPGGRLLVLEPKGHVKEHDFQRTLKVAGATGLRELSPPGVRGDHTALLEKP